METRRVCLHPASRGSLRSLDKRRQWPADLADHLARCPSGKSAACEVSTFAKRWLSLPLHACLDEALCGDWSWRQRVCVRLPGRNFTWSLVCVGLRWM